MIKNHSIVFETWQNLEGNTESPAELLIVDL